MGATVDAPKVEPSAGSGAELPPESSPQIDAPGPFERIASALKVAALAIGPTLALGIALACCPDVTYGPFFFVQIALLYAVGIGGASVVMRWLAIGSSPFLDRATTTPFLAAGLAGAVAFAARMFDPETSPNTGPMLTIPFIGTFGLYWSIASTFLARDGEERRAPRRRSILDLSLALLLLGLYAAALRWLIAQAELDEDDAAQTALYWTAVLVGFALIPFAIDLACRFAVRSKARSIYLAIGLLGFFGGLTWSLAEMTFGIYTEPSFYVFSGVCYLALSAGTAVLIAWRPLLPTVRRLDRERAAANAGSADVPLVSSSNEERS